MKVTCEVCELAFSSIACWQDHLLGELHQERSCRRKVADVPVTSPLPNKVALAVPVFILWGNDINQRTIVVTEINYFLVNEPYRFVKHFLQFGLITDIILDPRKRFAVIQYDLRETVEKVINTAGSNVCFGRTVRIRRRSHISAIEWIILMDLDGKYDEEDQQFFIRHVEITSSVVHDGISQQFGALIRDSSLGKSDIEDRKSVLRDLAYIIHQNFPKVYIYPMIPLLEGFQENDGIFEVYVDPFHNLNYPSASTESSYMTPEYQANIMQILYVLQNQTVLPLYDKFGTEIATIPVDAYEVGREKIVKGINFFHKKTGVRSRISFDPAAAMSANVSSLLSYLMSLDARVLPFLRFLHYFARARRFSQDHPETYMILTQFAMVYLIRKNIIPSIYVMQHLGDFSVRSDSILSSSTGQAQHQPYYVDGWDVSFVRDLLKTEAYLRSRGKTPHLDEITLVEQQFVGDKSIFGTSGTKAVLASLGECLDAFGAIELSNYVVCSYIGELLPRSLFQPGFEGGLPSSLHSYKVRAFNNGLDLSRPLVVQHPFNQCANIAYAIDEATLLELQTVMRETASCIKSELLASNPRIMNLFPQVKSLLRRVDSVPSSEVSKSMSEDSGYKEGEIDGIPYCSNSHPDSAGTVISYSSVAKKANLVQAADGLKGANNLNLALSCRTTPASDSTIVVSKMMKFEVNKRFREAFINACCCFSGEGRVRDRLKILAIVFMRDFIWSVWGRSFYLHAASDKVQETEQKFQDITKMFSEYFPASQLNKSSESISISLSDCNISDDFWQNGSSDVDEDMEMDDENWVKEGSDDEPDDARREVEKLLSSANREREEIPSKISPRRPLTEKEKTDLLRMKFNKIPKSACKNYCQVMKVHGYQKIWRNRRAIRASLAAQEKFGRCAKEAQSSKSASEMPVILTNPFEKEEAVTRAVLDGITGWGKTPSRRAIWSFKCNVRIDTVKEFPTLFLAMSDGRNPSICQNMINYFGTQLPSIFSEYMAYRLTKWLDVCNPNNGNSPRN